MTFTYGRLLAAVALVWVAIAPAVWAADEETPWTTLADGSLGRVASFVSPEGETVAAYERRPAGDGVYPLVIMMHGGGASQNGTYNLGRQSAPPTPQFIAAGFAIYSIDFEPRHDLYPEIKEWRIVARAIATARQFAYVDSRRVALMGQSHGGTVSLITASRSDVLCAVPCAPAAINPIAAWQWQQAGHEISSALQTFIADTAASYGVSIETLAADPAAYGYRDMAFFGLRLLFLHETEFKLSGT